MPTYQTASGEVTNLAHKLIRKFYKDLADAEVTINYLFAYGNDGAPAIMHHGWPANGLVKVVSLRDRVAGLNDVVMLIDGDKWPDWTDEERAALIDHELYHLEVVPGKNTRFKKDDVGRPKIRLRPHDFEFGAFSEIARRHGANAFEVKAFLDMQEKWSQGVLQFEAGV